MLKLVPLNLLLDNASRNCLKFPISQLPAAKLMSKKDPTFTPVAIDNAAVLNYLTSLQAVITRLAANSSSCKTFCIALTSAIITVLVKESQLESTWAIVFPILILGILDAYYLSLERGVRTTYNSFVTKLRQDKAKVKDLFHMAPTRVLDDKQPFPSYGELCAAIKSPSVSWFYGPLFILVVLSCIASNSLSVSSFLDASCCFISKICSNPCSTSQ